VSIEFDPSPQDIENAKRSMQMVAAALGEYRDNLIHSGFDRCEAFELCQQERWIMTDMCPPRED